MKTLSALVSTAALLGLASLSSAAATVGEKAPGFTLKDSQGRTHTLDGLKGKYVVLEWVNYDCPFVGKHYGSGNMPSLQKTYTAKGVVWLSVNSSAPGKQGHFSPAEIAAKATERKAAFTAYLVDGDGAVGRAYGAKTTPHMFVIDPAGTVVYAGGIDDTPSTDQADVQTAKNYVRQALDEALAGKAVTVATSAAYGCPVKY